MGELYSLVSQFIMVVDYFGLIRRGEGQDAAVKAVLQA